MNKNVNDLKQCILGCDPYEGFDYSKYPVDLTGGEIYPIVQEIVEHIKPRFVIEVGTWKGKSAIHMANLLKEQGIDDPIIMCVDTWLGSDLVHTFSHLEDETWGIKKLRRHGYSTMYYQFLANVCYAGFQDVIVPFPNTSSVAAKWLNQQQDIEADVIYIDGSHEEEECYLDLVHFWPKVRNGGVMFGDDFSAPWFPVICAVNRFVKDFNLHLMIAAGDKWVLQKTV